MSLKRAKLTAIVLTQNESKNISACLKTISWCDKIILIDDSIDDTVAKAKKIIPAPKLKVIHSTKNNFAYLRNLGLKKARYSWVFFVDADHRLPPALKKEIHSLLQRPPKHKAYRIKQHDVLFGKKLMHGEVGHTAHILLGRREAGLWHRRVHEKWHVRSEVGELKHLLLHYPHQTIEEFISHINRWSTLDALEFKSQGETAPLWQVIVYPVGKFLYNYFWHLGFLDGIPGLIVASIMSLHSLSVRIKLRLLHV